MPSEERQYRLLVLRKQAQLLHQVCGKEGGTAKVLMHGGDGYTTVIYEVSYQSSHTHRNCFNPSAQDGVAQDENTKVVRGDGEERQGESYIYRRDCECNCHTSNDSESKGGQYCWMQHKPWHRAPPVRQFSINCAASTQGVEATSSVSNL
mmetsp:Transcript_2909/g.11771  ORF Transcript_2909/g.11771 Transcript_2909/m.11771 type:complete len:150 (-) Transcript_2909:3116-3565(-)